MHTAALFDSATTEIDFDTLAPTVALLPIGHDDPRTDFCLELAYRNMNPYLQRRGDSFDKARWREHAPEARFFLVVKDVATPSVMYGFLSVRNEPSLPNALHIGDIQVDAEYRNRGVGTAALAHVERVARNQGATDLTLNVFRDNPALRLYERFGFFCTDTRFYKYKMRKILMASTSESDSQHPRPNPFPRAGEGGRTDRTLKTNTVEIYDQH